MKRVAVIGAGPAGLGALRHMLKKPDLYSPVAFEAMHDIGGQWLYSDKSDVNQYGVRIHSSIYKDLVINIPKDTMQYSDHPFPKDWPEYPTHHKMFEYINGYVDLHGLRKHIRLNSGVISVKPVDPDNSATQWDVTIRDNTRLNDDNNFTTERFDAVICAVGLCSYPNIPDIPGLDQFKGKVTHSHYYRVPEAFKGERVLTIGASYSGQDISIAIGKEAKEVVISHNKPVFQFPMGDNVRQVKGIESFTETSGIMKDGEQVEMDTILFCTGYRTNVTFLTPECKLNFDNNRIFPLYKHTIHAVFPDSFAVIGCCEHDIPFRQTECQVKFTLSAWEGVCKLPSSEDMIADQERDFQWRLAKGRPTSHAHHLSELTRGFENELAKLGKFEPYSPILYDVYDVFIETLDIGMPFKHWEYKRGADGEYDLAHLKMMLQVEKKKVNYVEPTTLQYIPLDAE